MIKESDGSNEGCHSSRADAIKHQRALYANESRVAAMYADLDAQQPEAVPEPAMSTLSPLASELVGLLLKDERERSLTASLVAQQTQMQQRMEHEQTERQALVAALERMSQPVVHVAAPDVKLDVEVAAPAVTVEPAQVNIPAPEVKVEVAAPSVTVRPEIVVPNPTRTVKLERDPLTGRVASAEVTDA